MEKAIILAGGKGTRLNPLTLEVPKPLITVRKKPIINYLFDLFYNYKLKDIKILTSPEWECEFKEWQEEFKKQWPGVKKELVIEEKPLGTFGGVVKYLKNWIKNDDFFLTNGDELKDLDLEKMMKERKGVATIALVCHDNPQDYGVAVLNGNRIECFLEKPKNPPSNYISSGLYLINSKIFDYCPEREFIMIEKDIFPRLAEDKELYGFKFRGQWFDCGTFDRWEEAIKKWPKRKLKKR